MYVVDGIPASLAHSYSSVMVDSHLPNGCYKSGVTTQAGDNLMIGWFRLTATRLHRATRVHHRAIDWSALGSGDG